MRDDTGNINAWSSHFNGKAEMTTKRKLSSYEKETIINFNEAEPTACIFTYNKTWQKHLEQNLGLKPVMDNGYGGKEYEISKKRIKPPRAPVKLSAETKTRMAKRLEKVRQSRVSSSKTLVQTKNSSIKKKN